MKKTVISTKRIGAKRSNVESNLAEKKNLKKKLVASSDFEYDVEAGDLDILPASRKNIGGKKIPINNLATPFDNVSIHTKENIQK